MLNYQRVHVPLISINIHLAGFWGQLYIYIYTIIIYWLVVSTPLKNMKVSWDDYSQYMEKKNVPNHQSENVSLLGYKPRGGAAKTGFAHRKFRKTTNRGDPDVVSSKSGCFYYEKLSNHVKSCGCNAEIWNKLKLKIWEGMQNLFQREGFIWNQLNQNGRESEKKKVRDPLGGWMISSIMGFSENVVPPNFMAYRHSPIQLLIWQCFGIYMYLPFSDLRQTQISYC